MHSSGVLLSVCNFRKHAAFSGDVGEVSASCMKKQLVEIMYKPTTM